VLLYEIIRHGAEAYPDREAILFRHTVLTYGELARQVRRLAGALRARGIAPGDSVAVLLPNCPQFAVVYYAVTALGAICVPANPLLKPAELEYIWANSRVKLAVTAPLLLANAQEAQRALPGLQTLISTGAEPDLPEGVLTWAELMTEGSEDFDPNIQSSTPRLGDTPAVCIYTSGTTGRPKGALLSHRNLTANCRQVSQALRLDERDNFLCVLPLFHSFAGTVCQNTPLFCGARTTLLELFHPARVLEAIEAHRVTIFPGVPAMFGALVQFPTDRPYDFSSVRICVSGGAPMPVAIMEEFERKFGAVVIEGDGPTECSPVTSVNPPEGVRKPGTIGLPLSGVEMKIFDNNDRELPPDTVGEIVVRGENVMLGYLNQPEATAEAMKSGWYHTGDLGTVDADGYFSIVDRKKDMLIVGGLNVYPREVEEVLYAHPAVADAAVIGAPDPLRGEEVVAIVTLKPGAQATDRELIAFCRRRIANFKAPRRVIFRDALPRSGTGKVLKRLLRKELELESGAQPGK
jgi:long-chain acyl-CoA synthetase